MMDGMHEMPDGSIMADAEMTEQGTGYEQPTVAGGLSLSDGEIQILRDKIDAARKEMENLRLEREKAQNAYFRQPLGNEREGRSKVVASDVFNHVESTHPHLMRQFLATDHKIAITGGTPKIGKALKIMCREAIHDQGGFRLVSDVLKDGEISGNGTAKVWWSRIWGASEERELPEVLEEELVKLSNDVRFTITELVPNPIRRAEVDDGIVDPRTGQTTKMLVEGKPTYRIRVTFTPLEESGPVIAAMPPEELICERGKIRVNDRKGIGHRTMIQAGVLIRENERLSMPDEPYYSNLDEAIKASAPSSNLTREDDERRQRDELKWDSSPSAFGVYSEGELRKECELVEWSDWVVSGGKMVPATVTLCNGVVIRAESNEDGIVPICTWSPIVNPHSIYGQSLAWLHADDQNLRTVLFRALLDSIAFSIDRPWIVKNRGADMLALQNLVPGQVVFGNKEDIESIQIEALDPRIFTILEYIKSEGEERGPGTRYNQGTDSDSLNKTATGVSLIQRASMSKIEMIAMAFAELFLVDLYNKLIFLYQRNLDLPKEVVVDGERMQITREMIQGDYRARSDMGLVIDYDDREFSKKMALLQMAGKVAEKFPMLYPLQMLYKHVQGVYLAAGIKDPNEYVLPPPQQLRGWMPGMSQQPGKPGGKPGVKSPKPISKGGAQQTMQRGPVPGMPPSGPLMQSNYTSNPDRVSGNQTSQPDETMMGR